ncbi:MAG: hypothetical protein WC747_02950 [Candidatus Babeliales bacterium]
MALGFLDNSIIKNLRKDNGSFNPPMITFILKKIEKYEIFDFLLTDKLFLEIIHEGQLRNKIVRGHKELIVKKQVELFNQIITLAEYITFFDDFFNKQFRQKLPQSCLYNLTIDILHVCPFAPEFQSFQEDVLAMASNLANDQQAYDYFIKSLVADSVIRYSTSLINSKAKQSSVINIGDIFSILLKAYNSVELLRHEMLPFMTELKYSLDQDREFLKSVKSKQNKGRLLRIEDDFVDSELAPFFVYGARVENGNYPVIVITGDKNKEEIRERLDYYAAGILKVSNQQLFYSDYFKLASCDGKVIIVDCETYQTVSVSIHEVFNSTKTSLGPRVEHEDEEGEDKAF